jgi:hypothetical protein
MSNKIFIWGQLINKTIVAIKSYPPYYKTDKYLQPELILFNDEETILKLETQDCYSYHDCDGSARCLEIIKDKEFYDRILKEFPNANTDIGY